MKQNKKKARRRISGAGYILLCYLCVAAIWPVDAGIRAIRKPPVHPAPGEGIIADGSFGDDGMSGSISVEVQPDPIISESSAEGTEAPTGRIVQEAAVTSTTLPAGCVAIPQESKDMGTGKLVLLDSEHSFTGSAAGLVTFEEKNKSYRMRHMELVAKSEVIDAMNRMAAAYEASTGRTDLMVYSTTQASSAAGALYPDELPDRPTGYCLDLCIFNEDETISPIREDGTWLANNAYVYGFVQSYTAETEEATGIGAAPYHLRYVGVVHAAVMHEEGLTLSAYLDKLHDHTISNPYCYSDGSKDWSVYYVPATLGGTDVPVPLNANYEISGNNTDGFIVTAEGKIGG